jgi:CHAT domain-containing protein/Tfp pilus assembly protein PilF
LSKIIKKYKILIHQINFKNIKKKALLFCYLILITPLCFSQKPNEDIPVKNNEITVVENYLERVRVLMQEMKYDSIPYYLNKSIPVFKVNELWEQYTECFYAKGQYFYYAKSDVDSIKFYIDRAISECNNHSDSSNILVNKVYLLSSYLLKDLREYDQSIAEAKKAISNNPNISYDEKKLFSTCYNIIALNYRDKDDYLMAEKYYKKAIENSLLLYPKFDKNISSFYNNISILYKETGDFDKSMEYINEAIEINRKYIGDDYPGIGGNHINLGLLCTRLGKYDEAFFNFFEAEKIYSSTFDEDHKKLALVYLNIGNCFSSRNNYEKAIEYYKRAMYIANMYKNQQLGLISKCYTNLGGIYLSKDEYNNALEMLNKSLSICKNNNIIPLTSIYTKSAKCFFKLNRPEEADEYYQIAINTLEKKFGYNNYKLFHDYHNYGNFCIHTGEKNKGLKYLNKALKIAESSFGLKHPKYSSILSSLGDFYFNEGDYKLSLDYYQKALIGIIENFNETEILINPDPGCKSLYDIRFLSILKEKAVALWKLAAELNEGEEINYLKKSLETFEQSIDIIHKIRISYPNQDSKLVLSEKEKSTFNNAIQVAVALYELTGNEFYKRKSFELAEKSKAALLLASIQDTDAKKIGNIPDSLQQQERKIHRELFELKDLIGKQKQKLKPDFKKITYLENQIFMIKKKKDALISFIDSNFNDYYELKYKCNVADLDSIHDKLDDKQAIIEYVISDSLLNIFAFDRNQFVLISQKIDTTFFENLKTLISVSEPSNVIHYSLSNLNKFKSVSFDLYKKLILPVQNIIENKNIIIVPDQKLSYLPFGLLLTDSAINITNYNKLPYLIKTNAIGYSYSLTLLFKNYESKAQECTNMLAFAKSYENDFTEKGHSLRQSNGNNSDFAILKGTIDEVNNISEIIDADVYLNNEATENVFKDETKNYDIIHVALHTIINNKKPMFSNLVFSQSNDSDDDGLLNTYEIYGLDINAHLIVLSACETGCGKLNSGEGIMSLARGFLYAGCPGVVMTLWKVEDNQSAKIITSFYKYLAEGKSKIEALRLSKLDYLKNSDPLFSHPYFWAGYVDIGKPNSLIIKKKEIHRYILFIAIFLILLAATLTIFKIKIRK